MEFSISTVRINTVIFKENRNNQEGLFAFILTDLESQKTFPAQLYQKKQGFEEFFATG